MSFSRCLGWIITSANNAAMSRRPLSDALRAARTNARMKAQAADAMEYLKQLEANEQYQQEDATASS